MDFVCASNDKNNYHSSKMKKKPRKKCTIVVRFERHTSMKPNKYAHTTCVAVSSWFFFSFLFFTFWFALSSLLVVASLPCNLSK